jgi:hypothetical protein
VDLEKFLARPFLRNLRDLVATVRAVIVVATVLASMGLFAYVLLRRNRFSPTETWTILLALVVWWITAGGFWYYIRYISNPTFYEILELEGLLVIESAGDHYHYKYERTQTVRALRNDLRLIEFRSHWTGASKIRPRVESAVGDYAILDGRHPEEDGRVHRWVYPRRPIGKGREVIVGIKQEHEDDVHRQLPYFREGGGRYKTRRIKVTTRFHPDEDPRVRCDVEGKVWNINRTLDQDIVAGSIRCVRVVNRELGTVDYIVVVDKPKRYHSYGMEWEWPPLPDEEE